MRVFFEEMEKCSVDIRKMAGAKIAAIGEGTKKELKKHGLFADLVPEVYDGASLGKMMARTCEKDANILIPRASIGNQEIIQALSERQDLKVDDIATYDTRYIQQSVVDETGKFMKREIDCAVFTSASTVRGFVEATPGLDYTNVTAACIGKQTKAAADTYGMKTYMAEKATIDSVVELVIKMYDTRGQK